mmetsp:Transcript_17657/g.56473  ORF Transcript_17657/g.56473 Transcript_17657/m.56473 type:complete len:204 (+) Transcript_17657:391-1002(+)
MPADSIGLTASAVVKRRRKPPPDSSSTATVHGGSRASELSAAAEVLLPPPPLLPLPPPAAASASAVTCTSAARLSSIDISVAQDSPSSPTASSTSRTARSARTEGGSRSVSISHVGLSVDRSTVVTWSGTSQRGTSEAVETRDSTRPTPVTRSASVARAGGTGGRSSSRRLGSGGAAVGTPRIETLRIERSERSGGGTRRAPD